MFIQRFVLVVAIVAAAVPLAAQTLITNGGFELTGVPTGDGSMPPNEIRGWAAAYGTPQILQEGCRDPGSIAMSGNLVAGEAIRQPVALYHDVRYRVSLCARLRSGPVAKMVLRTSTEPLGSPRCAAPAQTCESVIVANNVAEAWSTYETEFTPARDSSYLTLSASNNHDVDVSRVEVDDVSITVADRAPEELAPLIHRDAPGTIPHQYIVLFKKGTPWAAVASLIAQVDKLKGRILFQYTSETFGFAVNVENSPQAPQALQAILENHHVKWVEQDQRVSSSYATQTVPQNKGLDRIDQRLPFLNGRRHYSETGLGVHVYVFDTGISPHAEFGNRLSSDPPTAFLDPITGPQLTTDCNGHGSHVAGTLAGTNYGVAKNATIHSVRVMNCKGWGEASAVISGVDWLTANKVPPAVANLSISGGDRSPSLDEKVEDSIKAGITYVVAAHNRGDDACKYSPAGILDAITVGAVNPQTDVRYVVSNYGPCVDVFAPGTAILSAWHVPNKPTNLKSGTSMAAPHVAGVAALYLETSPTATPADVWNKIHDNNNVETTPNWAGVKNGDGTPVWPNELLHWGPLSEGYGGGDRHLTTVDGTHYDFQSAGEFVLLRGGDVEIQTRQTPVTTFHPDPYSYDGLVACVSITTAIAARVGSHRVTYQPDPRSMQLRVDGNLVSLSAEGIHLAGGGRIVSTAVGGGIEIQFPDDTVMTAVPGWWASQEKWFLNVHVNRTRATDGIMGAIAQESWLPALPDGTSLGPMPLSLHQRYVDLYRTFADAWRVTQSTSLFDYGPGTSTETFTNRNWPPEQTPCTLANERQAKPGNRKTAQRACRGVRGERTRADCIFDVTVTGERAFATAYLRSQQLRSGATSTVVTSDKNSSAPGDRVTFTATVTLLASSPNVIPAGTVQFFVDGARAGEPVRLDDRGRASWMTAQFPFDTHQISARYFPARNSQFLASSSANRSHLVSGKQK